MQTCNNKGAVMFYARNRDDSEWHLGTDPFFFLQKGYPKSVDRVCKKQEHMARNGLIVTELQFKLTVIVSSRREKGPS